MKYTIDYTYGTAEMWTPVPPGEALRRFYQLANECFGIRKSIYQPEVTGSIQEDLPEPYSAMPGAYEMLQHSGDTIVWDAEGNKIVSEWDLD